MYTVNRADFKLDCIALLCLIALMAVVAQQVLDGNLGAAVIGGILGFTLYPPLTSLAKNTLMMRRCYSQPLEYKRFVSARTQLLETLDELLANETDRSLMLPSGKWMRISCRSNVISCRVERFIEEVYLAEDTELLQHSHRYIIHRSPDMPITMQYIVTNLSERESDEPQESDKPSDTVPPIVQLFSPMGLIQLFRNDPSEIATQVSAQELMWINDELRSAA